MPQINLEYEGERADAADSPGHTPPEGRQIWSFEDVFSAEYRDLFRRNTSLLGGEPSDQIPTVANGLTGIALSGGGIRSASFSLGVLQTINAAGILDRINYLSTVSGGGYIGTAMTVGMSTNNGKFPFGKTGEDAGETAETRHLRDNSRYLLQSGVRSAISAVAIYLRGIVMNVLVALPFLIAAAALLVLAKPDTYRLASPWQWLERFPEVIKTSPLPLSLIGAGLVLLLLLLYAVGVSIFPILPLKPRRRIAMFAALVLAVFAAVLFFEVHLALLRMAFGVQGEMAFPTAAAIQNNLAVIPDTFLKTIKAFLKWATPITVVILPFVKSLSEKAISEKTSGFSDLVGRWGSRLVLILMAAIVPLILWLVMLQFVYWGIGVSTCGAQTAVALCSGEITDTWKHAPAVFSSTALYGESTTSASVGAKIGLLYFAMAGLLLLLWPFFNVNANSLHQLYRDRLGSAFLVRRSNRTTDALEAADNFKLGDIRPASAPYHLINAALNIPGSSFANRRGRNADFFLFSHRFVGSEATGYVPTPMAEHVTDGLNIGTAMAISGAAAAPNMGTASLRPLSPTIAFLNVRLGRWLRHPIGIVQLTGSSRFVRWWKGKPGPVYLLKEAFFKSGATITDPTTEAPISSGFVFLTDGGHIENLGVYELLRRRCAVIIAVDGEADPDLSGSSLVQLERYSRIDLGIRIQMDWKPIGERFRLVSQNVKNNINSAAAGPHVALGLIDYPPAGANTERETGVLVYIKASLSGDENDYIMAYKTAHPSFPHESTLDQLFSEEQFECYRALGEHIGRRFLSGQDPASAKSSDRANLLAHLNMIFPDISPA
jgi:Patatin-like phospholipase